MARNYFIFGGIDSRDYGIYISGSGAYNAPAREYELVAIPGRSGDLVLSGGRLSNIQVTYPAFTYGGNLDGLRRFVTDALSLVGYQDLVDSYHPDEFRRALFAGPVDVSQMAALQAGAGFDLTFNCKPQRFLTSGTQRVSGNVTNPEATTARPLIYITGTGTFTVGSGTVTVNEADGVTVIDSDLMEIYDTSYNNRAAYVELSGNSFPVLLPGENTVSAGVELIPRWWRL